MKQYYAHFDWLRIAAAVSVVLIHVFASSLYLFEPGRDVRWWLAAVNASSTHWAVPVFFMMSGALYIQKKEAYSTTLRRVLVRLGMPLVFAILGYAVIKTVFQGEPFSLMSIFSRVVFDQPYQHLYFLFVLIFILLLMPLWNRWAVFSKQRKRTFLAGCTLLTLFWFDNRFLGTFWLPYISYFLWGHVLISVHLSKTVGKSILAAFLLSTLAILLLTWRLTTDGVPTNDGFWAFRYTSPFVMIQSFSLFVLFSELFKTSSKRVRNLSRYALGVYLIHPAILWGYNYLLFSETALPFEYVFRLSQIFLLTLITSTLIVKLFYQLTDPLSSKHRIDV